MKNISLATLLILAFSTASAFSAEKVKTNAKKSPMGEITAAQRADMAASHEKMASCLRSDKALEDCQNEMKKTCRSMMGKDGCPMMGKMHGTMGRGMMQERGKMEDEESEEMEKK